MAFSPDQLGSAVRRTVTAIRAQNNVTLAVPRPITKVPAIPAQGIPNPKHKISKNTAPVHGRIAIEPTMASASNQEVILST